MPKPSVPRSPSRPSIGTRGPAAVRALAANRRWVASAGLTGRRSVAALPRRRRHYEPSSARSRIPIKRDDSDHHVAHGFRSVAPNYGSLRRFLVCDARCHAAARMVIRFNAKPEEAERLAATLTDALSLVQPEPLDRAVDRGATQHVRRRRPVPSRGGAGATRQRTCRCARARQGTPMSNST